MVGSTRKVHKEGAQVQSQVHHLPVRALRADDHYEDSPFKGGFGTLFASSQKTST